MRGLFKVPCKKVSTHGLNGKSGAVVSNIGLTKTNAAPATVIVFASATTSARNRP
ncbi:hypothetical protein GCM10027567_06440 [Spongiibacter taiwanensis]